MEIQSKTIPKKVAYEPAPEDIEPTGLRYEEIKPLAIEGNIRDMVFTPSNGQSWAITTATKLVRIPLNTSGFLIPKESYLSFTFTPTNCADSTIAGAVACDTTFVRTAHAVIRNFRIIGPGNERLEDIQDYNVLYEIFRSNQVSGDYQTSTERIKSGYNHVMANASANNFVIHPLSGLFLSDKYIPVGFLREPLVLEIDLEVAHRAIQNNALDPATAATRLSAGDYTISNVEFHATILDMGPTYEDQFKRMLIENNGIEWGSIGYSLTSGTATGGTVNNLNCVLPYHSLKSIIAVNRLSTYDAFSQLYTYLDSFISNNITQYRWRIGGRQYPDSGSVLVGNGNTARAFTELQRCFGIPSSINDGGITTGDITARTSYRNNTAAAWGKFMIGIDLETYNEDSSIIRSGMDTTKGQTMQLQLNSGAALNAATVINFYGIYDVVFYLSPTGELKAVY